MTTALYDCCWLAGVAVACFLLGRYAGLLEQGRWTRRYMRRFGDLED